MKTAILVISFGTSHRDTLEKTIGAVEKKLKYEFKTDVFRAFTSGMIIKKLRERDGIEIDTVDEALEKLYKSGYTDIFCVPTHIMCGIESEFLVRLLPKRVTITTLLIFSNTDLPTKTDFTFLWDTAATILRMPPTLPLIITLKMPI